MAEIGKQLLLPEYGWKRVDSADANIQSNTAAAPDGSSYGGSYYWINGKGDYVRFNFTGTKLRLICLMQAGKELGTLSQGGEAIVSLDGAIVGTFNTQHQAAEEPLIYQTLNFELLGLKDTEHSLVVSNPAGGYDIWFDAVDIGTYDSVRAYDETHAEYNYYQSLHRMTKRNNRAGDKFACSYTYTGAAIGKFGPLELTESAGTLDSNADGSKTQHFNFVFVGYAPDGSLKFVADRNVQDTTWETLNSAGYCTMSGVNSAFDQYSPRIRYRLPHSALAEGEDGEWDAILVSNSFGGKVKDAAVFWNTSAPSWTLNVALDAAANRVIRGGEAVSTLSSLASTGTGGFRPVLLINPVAEIVHRPDEETDCPLMRAVDIKRILPGQAISCEYTAEAGKVGSFKNLGTAAKALLADIPSDRPDGTFYFICVGYTPGGDLKLVADRNLQSGISWETLNAAGYCTMAGGAVNIDDTDGLRMRLLGTVSQPQIDEETYGEWDAIISWCNLSGTALPSDNAVWNCLPAKSWTLGIPNNYAANYRITRGGQDKDHILLRQTVLDSNATDAFVGFRPVLLVHRESRFLYLSEGGACYTVTGGALEKLADSWEALADEAKLNLFKTKGNESIAPPDALQSLNKFKLLAYTAGKNGSLSTKLAALPPEQVLLPQALFDIRNLEGISKAQLQGAFSGAGNCYLAVTADLVRYKTYRDGAWQEIDAADAEAMQTEGIAYKDLPAIPRAAWDEITLQEEGLAFACLLLQESVEDQAAPEKILLTADLKGQWEMAVPGSDYTYCYPGNDVLRVVLKKDGDYKINYEGAGEGTVETAPGTPPSGGGSESDGATIVVSTTQPGLGAQKEGDIWIETGMAK